MLDFNKLISQHLAREQRPKTVGRYYPSEIGGCLRKVWYSYTQPKETEMDLIKVFEVGNILHDFMAEVMRSEKVKGEVQLLASELPFQIQGTDFTVSGRVDDLLLLVASGTKLLVEVKSTKSLAYTSGPAPQHLMQLQLYMHALEVKDGGLLYIQKDNLQSKFFPVKYDEAVAKHALDRFHTLHHALSSKSIPEPEARTTRKAEIGWMCKNCEFREECFKETPDSKLEKH
jgi:CRISPR/Cas system-associated exonuclease Cas4 (RecB family)